MQLIEIHLFFGMHAYYASHDPLPLNNLDFRDKTAMSNNVSIVACESGWENRAIYANLLDK